MTGHAGYMLKHNARCRRPSRWVFVDTETRQSKPWGQYGKTRHELRLGVACFVKWSRGAMPREDWQTFTEPSGFWQSLEAFQRDGHPVWVYCHNAMFDMTILNLWARIESGEYKIRWQGEPYKSKKTGQETRPKEHWGTLALDNLPFICETMGRKGRVNFLDSMNYWPVSLAELGRMVGCDKADMPAADAPDDAWLAYCAIDVEILKRAVLGLAREWERDDNGNWQNTGPALALSHFLHSHYETPILQHDSKPARDLEWDAYYPGECRAFYHGAVAGPVYHYDVNSLYPACMVGRPLPVKLIDHVLSPRPSTLEHLMEHYCVIAEASVSTGRSCLPLRRNGRVAYPIGVFRTFLSGPEFLSAWRQGEVRAVHAVNYYESGEPFGSFVARWYLEKRSAAATGNTARYGLAKLLLNGLLGKFSQQYRGWATCPDVDVVHPWKSFPWHHPKYPENKYARSIGWDGQILADKADTWHTFPAIPAYVHAYAREWMRRLRERWPPRTVLYQDTDSLLTTCPIPADLADAALGLGDGLGQLKHVATYGTAEIRGPRNYTVDGRHVISGVRRKDVDLGNLRFAGERFERGPRILTRDPDGTIRSETVQGHFPGTCHEGGIGPDGWTFPVELA